MEQDAFLTEELLTELVTGEATDEQARRIQQAPSPVDRVDEVTADHPQYEHFMKNEPRRKVEGSTVHTDERGLRYQLWDIGMTRNAKAEHTRQHRVYIDPIPHVILDQNVPLRGWYKSKFEPPRVRARPCYTDALLTQPYGGTCSVKCGFCYINNGLRGYRGTGVTVVDPMYPLKIRHQVSKMLTAQAFYLSSFTDPFLELEPIYENTKRTAEVALDNGLPMFFLTRKQAPGWVYDFLRANRYSYMQFSINTPNPDDWRRLSPNAIPLADQIEQVREFHRRGIYVSIQVNPIVAGVVSNDDIVDLIGILAEAGADHLIFKFVEIVPPSAPSLVRNIRLRFGNRPGQTGPDRADAFEALFTQRIGGMTTIAEEYRKPALDRFKVACAKAGVTMALCYEYEYERGPDGKPLNDVGVSMGARYLTADQCHGHRVPVFARLTERERFREIAGCPPSGCLTCGSPATKPEGAQPSTGADVPCGSSWLGDAPAWQPKDLKRPAIGRADVALKPSEPYPS